MTVTPIARRSVLFVSAMMHSDLEPALTSGADIVCIDLEDAVPLDQKRKARAALIALKLSAHATVQIIIRINSLRSLEGLADIQACLMEMSRIGGILLPKVETGDEIRWAGSLVEEAKVDIDLYGIIETPDGLENCRHIACAHQRLKALFFGGFDLSTALGSAMDWESLLFARSRVVHAAACAGIESLDSPFPDIADQPGLRSAAERAKALGMVGKAAKHVSQIPLIREVFTPTSDEIEHARHILRRFRANPAKPLIDAGKLIELPTIKRLERIARVEI